MRGLKRFRTWLRARLLPTEVQQIWTGSKHWQGDRLLDVGTYLQQCSSLPTCLPTYQLLVEP